MTQNAKTHIFNISHRTTYYEKILFETKNGLCELEEILFETNNYICKLACIKKKNLSITINHTNTCFLNITI